MQTRDVTLTSNVGRVSPSREFGGCHAPSILDLVGRNSGNVVNGVASEPGRCGQNEVLEIALLFIQPDYMVVCSSP